MNLTTLTLANFRNYKKKSFSFLPITIIIGDNAIGKTNILEAIYFLSHGTSFRDAADVDTINLHEDFAKISGEVYETNDKTTLEVVLAKKQNFFSKKYTVNGVAKRQIDFVQNLPSVLFAPTDIELLTSTPSLRRRNIDRILIQSDRSYHFALTFYEKALKHRNRLLHDIREGKRRYIEEEFLYWNNLLAEHGKTIHLARKAYIESQNLANKEIFDFYVVYDHSTFTFERAQKYKDAEQRTGITLIGPQRDEFLYYFVNAKSKSTERSKHLISEYCSRGEQRLTVLQLKLLEIQYLREKLGKDPLLLLDDVFSELDQRNIEKIIEFIPKQQTIITTTHKEFVPAHITSTALIITL